MAKTYVIKDKEYIFIKEYENYILFKNKKTGFKESFTKGELKVLFNMGEKANEKNL